MFPSDTQTIYATVIHKEDHLEHLDGCQFDVEDFINHPVKYRSTLYEKVTSILFIVYQLI